MLFCITLSTQIQAAAWYNFWSTPAQLTQADHDLAVAVQARNQTGVTQALEQGADPNAKLTERSRSLCKHSSLQS